MLNKKILLLSLSFLFSQEPLFTLGKTTLYDYNFFETVPFSEWGALDSSKQRLAKNSFLEKELVFHDSYLKGLNFYGENFSRLKQRESQLLINFAYEKLVAFPLITEEAFDEAKKNILDKHFTHHILLGYKGCSMPGTFTKEKDVVFLEAQDLKNKLLKSLLAAEDSLKSLIFKDFALLESEDPSVSQNKGALGWVSWGRTVPSFQKAVFNLPSGSLSDPILTDFGYHLVYVEKTEPSDFNYYNPVLLDDLTRKTCLQSLDFELLRSSAVAFDSSLVSTERLIVNKKVVADIFNTIQDNTKNKKLRGNKNSYIGWIEEKNYSDVLFLYDKKAYGVGWFLYYIQKMPATRIPAIKKQEDFVSLLKSFVLQEAVLSLANKEGLRRSSFFKNEFLKHKKNILQKEYSSELVNSIKKPDSLEISNLYEKGVFRGDFIKPRSVVYSEIKTSSIDKINKAYNHYLNEKNFDSTLRLFNGSIKSPVTEGSGGPLSLMAFSMKPGEISSPIENRNKTFSLIRVEKFIKEEPFSVDKVYNQIERKIIKEKQDSVKFNLLKNLKTKHSIRGFEL